MKRMTALVVALAALAMVAAPATAEPKPAKKLTCCQKAHAEGKECRNRCCVAAHREGKSCTKCNPGKEDLALLKKAAPKAGKQ